jgi:hypothetical protein
MSGGARRIIKQVHFNKSEAIAEQLTPQLSDQKRRSQLRPSHHFPIQTVDHSGFSAY